MKYTISVLAFLSASLSQAGDPCLKKLEKTPSVAVVREISKEEYATSERDIFGRFFEIREKKAKKTVWMLPFASGKACVLREKQIL